MAFLAPEVPLSFSIHQYSLTSLVPKGEREQLWAVALGELPFSGVSLPSKEVSEGCFLRGVGRQPGLSLKTPTGREANGQGDKRPIFKVPISKSLLCQGSLRCFSGEETRETRELGKDQGRASPSPMLAGAPETLRCL